MAGELNGKDLRRIMPSPSKQVLNLHRGINKAHSTLIVQIGTAKIGLRHFLHTSKVPGITDGKCECRSAPRYDPVLVGT